MTVNSDRRQGRILARDIAACSTAERERVLAFARPAIRAAAVAHLAVLDRLTKRSAS